MGCQSEKSFPQNYLKTRTCETKTLVRFQSIFIPDSFRFVLNRLVHLKSGGANLLPLN
jgi:hypothetical protein